MLLGKRPRPPMKRTTSMTEFTLDLSTNPIDPRQPSDPHNPFKPTSTDGSDQRLLTPTPSLRNQRRNSADSLEIPHFLRSCSLCKRRLIPGRDIFMYRGDSAFCSLECRQQQMNQDEKKDKCSLPLKRGGSVPKAAAAAAAGAGSEVVAAKGETLTAV